MFWGCNTSLLYGKLIKFHLNISSAVLTLFDIRTYICSQKSFISCKEKMCKTYVYCLLVIKLHNQKTLNVKLFHIITLSWGKPYQHDKGPQSLMCYWMGGSCKSSKMIDNQKRVFERSSTPALYTGKIVVWYACMMSLGLCICHGESASHSNDRDGFRHSSLDVFT